MIRKLLSILLSIMTFFSVFPIAGTLTASCTAFADSGSTRLVAITFDDGPSGYTEQLLDGLKVRGAHATFFMTAKNGSHGINNHSSVLQRMILEGHQLANHSYDHPSIGSSSAAQVANEFNSVESLLFNAQGGSYLDMARTPGGAVNSTIRSNIGAPIILWSVDTLDWKNRNADTVYNNIVNKTGDGSIILLHDLYQTSIQGALRAIDTLQSRGYEFVTVAELMRRRGVTPVNGQTYTSIPKTSAGDLLPYTAPSLVPETDSATGSISVRAFVAESGIDFYYTTDGSTPTMKSIKYTGPVTVPDGVTLKLVGVDRYGTYTPVATANFTRTLYGRLFSDVSADSWYYDTVGEIVHSGLMDGVDTYSFDPDGTLTRAMMVTVLYRYDQQRNSAVSEFEPAAPEPGTNETSNETTSVTDTAITTDTTEAENEELTTDSAISITLNTAALTTVPAFDDVASDAWYYDAVCWAASKGITNGTDDTHFSPDLAVTREQIASMIYNYIAAGEESSLTTASFSDWSSVSDWSLPAVLWCLDKGIIGGNDKGELSPGANATRAQCAAILLRLRDYRK